MDKLINKGLSQTTAELVAYDGILLSDGSSVIYLNKRFGTAKIFDVQGKLGLRIVLS